MFTLFHSFTHYSNIDENKINKLIDSWMNCVTHYFGIVAFVNDKPNGCWDVGMMFHSQLNGKSFEIPWFQSTNQW